MTEKESKERKQFAVKYLTEKLTDILDLYKVDQFEEAFNRLTHLFIKVSIATAVELPEEKRIPFIIDLNTMVLVDMVQLYRQFEAESQPLTFTFNAEINA
jgi:hypothetical protein